MNEHKFPYDWELSKLPPPKNGSVFSCFACGGGSTMGYKLAGFNVIGCNEIDKRMNDIYVANHHPKFNYLCDIREMLEKDLPEDLYHLDILDGSPPCSTFSTAGLREKAWGKEKKFREGQVSQVLDTLFFDFIDLAKKLQPKVVIAENVKGLLMGSAREYVRKIHESFDEAGYYCQHFMLNGEKMGLPQRRVRVFFVCLRKDLAEPFLQWVGLFEQQPMINLGFNEQEIPFGEIADFKGKEINSPILRKLWEMREYGDSSQTEANFKLTGREGNFGQSYIYLDRPSPTLTAKSDCIIHFEQPRYASKDEVLKLSSFPKDYDFGGQSPFYICGMSVPPVMMAQVASRVQEQWLEHINASYS